MKGSIIIILLLFVSHSTYSQDQTLEIKINDSIDLNSHSAIIRHKLKDSVYIAADSIGLVGKLSLISFNNYEYWPISKRHQIFIISDLDTVYHSNYLNDSLTEFHYYPNGELSSISIHRYNGPNYADRLWVYQANYYRNGQLFFESNPNEVGLRKNVQYHRNGNVYRRFNVFYNLESGFQNSGKSETFYENGQIKSLELYSEYEQEEVWKSNEVGIWKYWDENGQIIKKINKNR